MKFDYLKILKAYLNHVGTCEGITFLGNYAEGGIPGLTAEEVEELKRIDKETNEPNK